MDIDRRYYNKNTGSAYNNFANINLQPGYQKLTGSRRSTSSASAIPTRTSTASRASRSSCARSASRSAPASRRSACRRSSTRSRSNIEVAEGGHKLQGKEVLNYALFAYGAAERPRLPGQDRERRLQPRLSGVDGRHPEGGAVVREPGCRGVEGRERGRARQKVKTKAPPPSSVTVTVLNGSGVAGRGREHLVRARTARLPDADPAERPQGRRADAGCSTRRSTTTRPRRARRRPPIGPAEPDAAGRGRRGCHGTPRLLALDPGSMLVVVLGTAFHGTLAPAPQHDVAEAPAAVRPLRRVAGRRPARAAREEGDVPAADADRARAQLVPGHAARRQAGAPLLHQQSQHKAVRLVFKTAGNEFWGIQETDWNGAPALERQELPAQPRRPRVRPLLLGLPPAHGRAARGAARPTGSSTPCSTTSRTRRCSRSQGPQTANNRKVGSAPMATSEDRDLRSRLGRPRHGRVLRRARARGRDPRRRAREDRRAAARRRFPSTRRTCLSCSRGTPSGSRYTLDVERHRRLRVPLRLRRHAADLLGRRRPVARLDGRRRAAELTGRPILVMKSTVPVGTGEKVRAGLDQRGLEHVGYASNPEFLAEGRAVHDFMNPDRIVVGASTPRTAMRSPASTRRSTRRSCVPTSTRPR